MSGRVRMLGAGAESLGWTYDGEQYALVRDSVLDAVAALGDYDEGVLLKDIVAFTQDRLGGHVRFPSGRVDERNAVRGRRPPRTGAARTCGSAQSSAAASRSG